MDDPRIHDLDDANAICDAFGTTDLDWATIPPAWRERALKARQDDDVPEFAWDALGVVEQAYGDVGKTVRGITTAVSSTFDTFLAGRARRDRVGPLFSALEIAWLRRCDRHRLRDPSYADEIAIEATTFGNALQFRRIVEEGEGWRPYRDMVDQEQVAARALIQRYLEAESEVLRQAVDQAVGEVERRVRARL